MNKKLYIFFSVLFLCSGCINSPETIVALPTSTQEVSEPTRSNPSQVPATSIPASPVPPTNQSFTVCPAPGDPVHFNQPTTFEEFLQEVLTYLNSGGVPSDLSSFLFDENGDQFGNIIFIDLDNDGADEVVLTIKLVLQIGTYKDGRPEYGRVGSVLIYQCSDGMFVENVALLHSDVVDISISFIDDLTGNGSPEIVIEVVNGITTCSQWVKIVGMTSTGLTIYFDELISCPLDSLWDVDIAAWNLDDDNEKEIMIYGWTTAGVSGGPGRGEISYYDLVSGVYMKFASKLLPSKYRVHALLDAQDALDMGDILIAIKLYEIAAFDEELQDFGIGQLHLDNPALSHEYATAFARFRIIALRLALGEIDTARSVLDQMSIDYPATAPGREFVELSQLMLNEVQSGSNEVEACSKVTKHIRDNFPNLTGYDGYLGEWGHDNISYSNSEICPFLVNEMAD